MHIFTHVTMNAGLAVHIYVYNKFLCLTKRNFASQLPPPNKLHN